MKTIGNPKQNSRRSRRKYDSKELVPVVRRRKTDELPNDGFSAACDEIFGRLTPISRLVAISFSVCLFEVTISYRIYSLGHSLFLQFVSTNAFSRNRHRFVRFVQIYTLSDMPQIWVEGTYPACATRDVVSRLWVARFHGNSPTDAEKCIYGTQTIGF